MNSKLYFVHEILEIPNNNKDKIGVVLFEVSENKVQTINSEYPIELKYLSAEEIQKNPINEGSFILLSDSEDTFKNGNGHPLAKRQFYINNVYRGQLIKKYEQPSKDPGQDISLINSYHINVGHGNCSLVVFRQNKCCNIWMIDCSNYDFRNRRRYQSNIQSCFEYIKKKYSLAEVKIQKLLITHPHFDHICGIDNLIKQNYLDDTEVWANFYYSWPETKYNETLDKLRNLNLHFIEPINTNSTDSIKVLYPEKTLLRVEPKPATYVNYEIVPSRKVNNASAIFKISLGNKSMIFPGDIEEEGWNKVRICFPFLSNSDYYCLSHHGSITGHTRSICPAGCTIANITNCCINKQVNILMGRDGAFPGIFNPTVLNAFNGRVYRTDQNNTTTEPSFLELDWGTNSIYYH